MNNIAVVVDSTAVIGEELLKNNDNLYMLPLDLIIDGNSFRDGLDITPSEFCLKMTECVKPPTTSQPSFGEVLNLFEEIVDKYDYIIYITISSKLSGTFQTGMLVRNLVSEDKIIVFDSLFTATIQKQMVITTLELIKNGSSIENIVEKLAYIRSNSKIYLVVDDLAHLRRTGRISLSAASVGSLLNIKPILVFEEGQIALKSKVRTLNKVNNYLAEIIENDKLTPDSKIIIAHANGYESALRLREKVLEIYPKHTITIEELSPVISTHTGSKSFGISWIY
ncbi:DegV family protein [Clostridium sp. 19966]|uniref:DegV family protein n=1 Tax=Clostridium sp. 19966 TaxID=2768166 RepID=UPI0028DEECD4|nr:DegV family protein [Clostridium sp. 19966]MDT8717335.1 DegV family protein [Clostridium sp. 19966]